MDEMMMLIVTDRMPSVTDPLLNWLMQSLALLNRPTKASYKLIEFKEIYVESDHHVN